MREFSNMSANFHNEKKSAIRLFIPGILMAMTGVGVGDLATSSFAGMKLGTAVLWAVLIGAGFKYVLTEGLTKWQLATGTTLLTGSLSNLGRPFFLLFGIYFLIWSYFVGAALISACGVSAPAIFGLKPTQTIKVLFGMGHSIAAILVITIRGYRLFARVMETCAALLFVSVLVCAIAVGPDWGNVIQGLFIPGKSTFSAEGLHWTVALMGGVGGTLTILCYGYWLKEEDRTDFSELAKCRLDLGVGYLLTALFGVGMVIIGSMVKVSGKGLGLLLEIGNYLNSEIGWWAKIVFLIGGWGAIFSSLLGVWQSVPLLFTDWIGHVRKDPWTPAERMKWSRAYLLMLGIIPGLSLFIDFKSVQKIYSIFGALFMPFVGIVLLYLNNKATLIGHDRKNGLVTNLLLIGILAFFIWIACLDIHTRLGL